MIDDKRNIDDKSQIVDDELDQSEDLQLAENIDISDDNDELYFKEKRDDLEKTKISKQTWSIRELKKKIDDGLLDLEPDYQRNIVWNDGKQVSFIESLLMGIIVPPLYFVEVPGKGLLDTTRYEVVDGKQRLNSIYQFVTNNLSLKERYLEYYGDIYSNKNLMQLSEEFGEEMQEFASQTLDIYVITASSPINTKYDIFSRLNKGAEPLKVNEIRRAVYHSELIEEIDKFVNRQSKDNAERYKSIFSPAKIKRYVDYGVFYKALSFYLSTNEEEKVIENYNSRPRELINSILSSFQSTNHKEKARRVADIPLQNILEKTLDILEYFSGKNSESYLECCIKVAVDQAEEFEKIKESIKANQEIIDTFEKSKSTTSNVNKRLQIVYSLINKG